MTTLLMGLFFKMFFHFIKSTPRFYPVFGFPLVSYANASVGKCGIMKLRRSFLDWNVYGFSRGKWRRCRVSKVICAIMNKPEFKVTNISNGDKSRVVKVERIQ